MRYDIVNSTKQVDLGTLNWLNLAPHIFSATFTDVPNLAASVVATAFLEGYTASSWDIRINKSFNFFYAYVRGINIIDNDFDNAADFKDAISGKILTYVSTNAPRRFDTIQSTRQVDLGSLTWRYNSSQKIFYAEYSGARYATSSYWHFTPGYTSYTYSVLGRNTKGVACGNYLTMGIHIKDPDYTNANDFKIAMTGKIMTYVYRPGGNTAKPTRCDSMISYNFIKIKDLPLTHASSSGRELFTFSGGYLTDIYINRPGTRAKIKLDGYTPFIRGNTITNMQAGFILDGDFSICNNNYKTVEEFKSAEGEKFLQYALKYDFIIN